MELMIGHLSGDDKPEVMIAGLHRLQSLFQELSLSTRNESVRMEVVRQVSSAEEILALLHTIDTANR
jgi:hypothetical protein